MTGCPVALDVTGADIHGETTALREQGAAVPVELPGGVVAYSLNSYDAVRRVLLDPNVTKSARNHWPDFREGRVRPDWEMISWVAMDNVSTAFGADHLRLRRLIGSAFTRRRTEAIKPRIRELTALLIDGLRAVPRGEVVDLREAFCYPLPGMLVADLIGMSEPARQATARVIDAMVDTTATPEQAKAVLAGWRGAMAELIAEKRAHPGEDITSDLIAARDEDGSRLSEDELTDTIFAILGAGSETTINFFGNAVTLLLTHPDQRRAVLSGEVGWDALIEEVLRVESPLAQLPLRYAVTDVEIDGVTIPQGTPVLVNYCGPGRDPAVHGGSADAFDVTRADKRHLAFGHGPHFCLGAGIARAVAEIGLSELFAHFPDVALAVPVEEIVPLPTFIMNGPRELPVRLTP